MSNPLVISCPPPRDISDADLIDELAELLVAGRQDPSDPDACDRYLLKMDVCSPRRLCDLLDRAIYSAGQAYINRELSRKAG
jgi:hypothetical protein